MQFVTNNNAGPARDPPNDQPGGPARPAEATYRRDRLAAYAWRVAPQYLVAESSQSGTATYRNDQPQTVEEIVACGYFAAPPGDPISGLIEDRHTTTKLGLDDVIGQVRGRYTIWWHNHQDIERAKLAAINALHDWEASFGPAGVELHASVHQTLQRLYQQQREERTHLWRDVSKLRLVLPEAAQQYLSAYRKRSILNEPGGEQP